MFKITRQEDGPTTTLLIEGRLAGPWVAELDSCWRAMPGRAGSRLQVDLTGVTFIDAEGKALLSRMWQGGAILHAAGCLTRGIVAEITGEAGDCRDAAQRKAREA